MHAHMRANTRARAHPLPLIAGPARAACFVTADGASYLRGLLTWWLEGRNQRHPAFWRHPWAAANEENRNIMRPTSAMKKSKVNLPEQQGDLEEYIEILYDHQKSCQGAGKYVEAEMAKRRL